jgi:hypothetical protein
MRYLIGVVFFVLVSGAMAADDLQLRRLEAALNAVRQEQQSVYQEFQMTEGLERSAAQSIEMGAAPYVPEGQAPSYDDAVRAKQEHQERLKQYSEDLKRLSARYRELGRQASALVEQIHALSQPAR